MASSLGDNSSLRICCHLKRHITSLQLAQVFGMLINNLTFTFSEIRAGHCVDGRRPNVLSAEHDCCPVQQVLL